MQISSSEAAGQDRVGTQSEQGCPLVAYKLTLSNKIGHQEW